jgi:hypothetical protein
MEYKKISRWGESLLRSNWFSDLEWHTQTLNPEPYIYMEKNLVTPNQKRTANAPLCCAPTQKCMTKAF